MAILDRVPPNTLRGLPIIVVFVLFATSLVAQDVDSLAQALAKIASPADQAPVDKATVEANLRQKITRMGEVGKVTDKALLREFSEALGMTRGAKHSDINDPGYFETWLDFSTRDVMFPERAFSLDTLKSHIGRLRQVPPKVLTDYCFGIEKASNSNVSCLGLACNVVRLDSLFIDKTLQQSKLEQRVARTKSIPTSTCKQWHETFGKRKPCLDLMWNIVELDQLFTDDAFQSGVFAAALPAAKRLQSNQ